MLAPSPRLRCRIKTNPWLPAPDAVTSSPIMSDSYVGKMENDTSSKISGKKLSGDTSRSIR